MVWDPLPGGGSYDWIYGDLPPLHSSGLTASVGGCLWDNNTSGTVSDPEVPEAGAGWWYLIRGIDPCTHQAATYDEGGNQIASRDPLIPAPPVDCTP